MRRTGYRPTNPVTPLRARVEGSFRYCRLVPGTRTNEETAQTPATPLTCPSRRPRHLPQSAVPSRRRNSEPAVLVSAERLAEARR